MPKIIKDLKSKLMEEAKKQLEEGGYSAMTVRSVANACNVGVGTVYNYFSSKDELLAAYMLIDWEKCITAINAVSLYSQSPEPVLRCIYDNLLSYAQLHKAVFQDPAAAAVFGGSFSRYHKLLRSQLAAPVRRFCSSDFAADFIAESILTWTMAGKSFDTIYGILKSIF